MIGLPIIEFSRLRLLMPSMSEILELSSSPAPNSQDPEVEPIPEDVVVFSSPLFLAALTPTH